MVKRSRIQTKTIAVDTSRSVPRSEDHGGIVLLYDKDANCYYETTVKAISSAFIEELRTLEREIVARQDAFEKRCVAKIDSLDAELREKQRKFISDTANATDKLINLVEANEK